MALDFAESAPHAPQVCASTMAILRLGHSFDAGSCIDGRLTSAWHFCAQLSKKPYYPLFQMSGFVGFDGAFGRR